MYYVVVSVNRKQARPMVSTSSCTLVVLGEANYKSMQSCTYRVTVPGNSLQQDLHGMKRAKPRCRGVCALGRNVIESEVVHSCKLRGGGESQTGSN
jgi:hypothetical protein